MTRTMAGRKRRYSLSRPLSRAHGGAVEDKYEYGDKGIATNEDADAEDSLSRLPVAKRVRREEPREQGDEKDGEEGGQTGFDMDMDVENEDEDENDNTDSTLHRSTRTITRRRTTPIPIPIPKPRSKDNFSLLSDEILLRILHQLPMETVLLCELVSRRLGRLASDGLVWRGLFGRRWGRRGIVEERSVGSSATSAPFSSAAAAGEKRRIFAEGEGKEQGRKGISVGVVDWKKRFKVRWNWARGVASVRRIGMAGDGGGSSEREEEEWKGDEINFPTQHRSQSRLLEEDPGLKTAESPHLSRRNPTSLQQQQQLQEEGKRNYKRNQNKRLIVRLVDGLVVTVDQDAGLRAWNVRGGPDSGTSEEKQRREACIARLQLNGDHTGNSSGRSKIPTCLGVDAEAEKQGQRVVVVGFQDGGWGVWSIVTSVDMDGDVEGAMGRFEKLYEKPGPGNTSGTGGPGPTTHELAAVALRGRYLLAVTTEQVLELWDLEPAPLRESSVDVDVEAAEESSTTDTRTSYTQPKPQPHLLTTLKSHTSWPPVSLSIRSTPGHNNTIIASIAYAFPTYLSGWTVGLQELHFSPSRHQSQPQTGTDGHGVRNNNDSDGTRVLSHSRLASAVENGFHSLLSPGSSSSASAIASPSSSPGPRSKTSSSTAPTTPSDSRDENNNSSSNPANAGGPPRPTSLSYAHPYLLASHSDNTLTLYLVTSNTSELKISPGRKLFGHTSAVLGAQVGGRGKAVSVASSSASATGLPGEVRVWELEGGVVGGVSGFSGFGVSSESRGGSGKRRARGKGSVKVSLKRKGDGEQAGGWDFNRDVREVREEDFEVGDGSDLEREKGGWVGFDEDVAVVLKEGGVDAGAGPDNEGARGEPTLVVYDFT